MATDLVTLAHRDPNNPGREFLCYDSSRRVNRRVYGNARGGGDELEIHTLLFSIPRWKMERADEAYVTALRNDAEGDHALQSKYNCSAVYKIELVDDDEGLAAYPLVQHSVSVGYSRCRNWLQVFRVWLRLTLLPSVWVIIETGDFTVRIILTEEPDRVVSPQICIAVKNGAATALSKGITD